jgi:hypothetical protein
MTSGRVVGAACLALVLALACAAQRLAGVDEPDFAKVVSRYRAEPGEKALALATEANGRFGFAMSVGKASPEAASQEALDSCQATAKAGELRSTCVLFAVGDAPAPETVQGCLARRLPSRRCTMQREFQAGLAPPRPQ